MAASATLRPCSCADDVALAWKHINSMSAISFDIILTASEQTIDFSRQTLECQARGCQSASAVREKLLRIYSKLLDLLEAAVATYTATARQLPDTPVSPLLASPKAMRTDSPPWESLSSSQARSSPQPTRQVACLPSKMRLGEHELDEQQSSPLALDLVCRTLRNFAETLRHMGSHGNGDLGKVDEKLLRVLSRVTRLADASLAALSAQHHHSAYPGMGSWA